MLGQHERLPLFTERLPQRLDGIAVLHLHDIPSLLQQLDERGLHAWGITIHTSQQRGWREQRHEQTCEAAQRAARHDDQLLEQRLEHSPVVGAQWLLALHQQRDAVPTFGQTAQQIVLAGLATAGGGPGRIRENPQ